MQYDQSYSLLYSLSSQIIHLTFNTYPTQKLSFRQPDIFYLTLFFKNSFSILPSDQVKLTKFNFSKLLYNIFRLHYAIRQRDLKDTTNFTYFLLLVLVIQLVHHFTAPDYSALVLPF